MTFRTENDLQAAFVEASQSLDGQIERARQRLNLEWVTFEERSNRTGFDKSGFPYFLWSFWFRRQRQHGPEVAVAQVEIAYLQASEFGETRNVQGRWIAEVFQTGQLSRFRCECKQSFGFDGVVTGDFASLVLDLIVRAESELPDASKLSMKRES